MDLISALGALKQTFDVIKTGVEIRDDNKVKVGISDFADKYITLQSTAMRIQQENMEMLERIRQSEAKCQELETNAAEKAKYELHEFKPGVFAYKYNQNDKPEHYVCQNCFDKGIKSVLRYEGEGEWYGASYNCAENEKHKLSVQK